MLPTMVMGHEVEQHLVHEMAALSGLLELPDDAVDDLVELELSTSSGLIRVEGRVRPDQHADPADLFAVLPHRLGARDELRADARPAVAPQERWLVDLVVDSLDRRGRLTMPVAEIAAFAPAPLGAVERALAAVRRCGPPGVAAQDLRECLLLQLADPQAGPDRQIRIARAVADRHLDDVAAGRIDGVAATLGCDAGAIRSALDLIRAQRPFVLLDDQPWPPVPLSGRASVRPDVRFRLGPGGVVRVELYRSESDVALAPGGTGARRDDVDRARALVNRLARRRSTVLAVARAIADRQRDFVAGTGPLRPMSQAEVAYAAQVDRSTVSRVVGMRWATLPSDRVIRLHDFFDAPPAVITAVREVLAAAGGRITDARLVVLLAARGHQVARRTVAGYRKRLSSTPA